MTIPSYSAPQARRWSLRLARLTPLLCALLLLVACGEPPPPKVPVRELSAPAASLLAQAPSSYGSQAPIALPDDRGSAAAQAAFAAMTGGAVVHEPSLDLIAAVVGRTYAEAEELPAEALLQWLYWKCGAASLPGPINVLVVPEGGNAYLDHHLRQLAAAVPRGPETFSFGAARIAVRGYVAQAIALGVRTVEIAPLQKSQAPGASVPVTITPRKPYAELTLYVDQGGPEVLKVPMQQQADGSFSAQAPIPSAPGRYFIEVVGVDLPPGGEVDKGWRVSALWLPLYAGTPEPAAPDEFIRHPTKNHPNPSTWPLQVLNAYNDARAALGRPPLAFDVNAGRLAAERSELIAGLSGLPEPDHTFIEKLADAGVPARNVFGYVDQIEYVSEYITLRLQRPAARYALFDQAMNTFAISISPRRVAPGLGQWNSVEYVLEQIHVDPPKERERLLAELDADEVASGGQPFTRSEPLGAAAQAVAEEVCQGGPQPKDAQKLFARAVGLDTTLQRRLAVPWLGYDLSKEEIAHIHEGVKGGGYTHVGVGVCQGTVDGHKGAVMVMALFAGP